MSEKEYKDAKKKLVEMGFITSTEKGVRLTGKGLTYIKEEFGLLLQDI
jgi:hypothetical protein